MSKPQITIKDIARELGVSPSTVSRALKDNPDISQETRDAIHKYAREHNYKPNVLALNLRTSRSNTIGVIIPQLVHHFFSCVLSGIERTAAEAGYNILVAIIRKSKFPQNPKRSVRFSGKRTKRSVQKRKARNTQKAETKVL